MVPSSVCALRTDLPQIAAETFAHTGTMEWSERRSIGGPSISFVTRIVKVYLNP